MRVQPANPTFTDLNILFGVNVYPELLYDEDVIRQSIYMILTTPVGTRLFRPDYGSQLFNLLYEPRDDISEVEVEILLTQSIEKWEPRVIIDPEKTKVININNGFSIDLHYTIRATNRQSNLSVNALR